MESKQSRRPNNWSGPAALEQARHSRVDGHVSAVFPHLDEPRSLGFLRARLPQFAEHGFEEHRQPRQKRVELELSRGDGDEVAEIGCETVRVRFGPGRADRKYVRAS